MTTSTVESVTTAHPAPWWARLSATFLGVGYLRPAPGTWGSLATVAIWSCLASLLPATWQAPVAGAAAGAATALGIPAASRVARATGKGDPSFVVIDEVAGQMLTLVGVPLHWKSLLAGLILFRAFDIVKPFPLRRLERLPGGVGIVVDDLGAGVYALAVLQLMLHYGWLR